MIYSSVPSGYRAIPLEDAAGGASWRAAILAKLAGESPSELVMLFNLPDARAYLGCLLDGDGMVRAWLEVWVQNLDGFTAASAGFEEQFSSELMDQKWQRQWLALRKAAPELIVFEMSEDQSHPLYVDLSGKPVHPKAPGGGHWVLCRNNQRLEAAGLPLYTRSTLRYLQADGSDGAQKFVTVDKNAPPHAAVPRPSLESGFDSTWIPVNPQGGRMAARLHPPLNFVDYADLLSGSTVAEIGARKRDCEAVLLKSCLTASGHDGRRHGLLLSDQNGAEVFYLKLRLLLQASRAVLACLKHHGCPMLNLDPSGFGVFPANTGDVPWPWSTTCEIIRSGRAFPLTIAGTSETQFIAVGDPGELAYCPGGLARRSNLSVTIWIDRVISEGDEKVSVEGKIITASPVQVAPSDLVRFRFSEGPIMDDFFGHISVTESQVREEIEFRTWPRAISAQQLAQLKRFEGGKLALCWCELIPALNSPYDLYSLSVLGARALLSHKHHSLSKVIGELERLGRAASKQLPNQAGLEQTIPVVERLLEQAAGDGPLKVRHLFGELPDASKLSEAIPPRLWAEAIAILLRLMTGLGPVSQCAGLGAAPGGAVHVPLEEPVAALENLCARVRSLIFCDWGLNREARAILAELRDTP